MDYKTLYEQSQKENEQLKLWKSIATQKTEALQHCFPSYNPAFQACDDKEEIIKMIEALKNKGREYRQKYVEILETDLKYEELIQKLKKENEVLKKVVQGAKTQQDQELEKLLTRVKSRMDDLKKENEELKKAHNYLRIYSICLNDWLDPCCKENHVSKEHIDETCKVFECNDDIKKQLYEDFCIEEDEDEEE